MHNILLLPIFIPIIAAAAIFFIPKRHEDLKNWATVLTSLICTALTYYIYGRNISFSMPWAGFGIEFSLRSYQFSSFIIAAASTFTFLIAIYSSVFSKGREYSGLLPVYLLLTLGSVNGAVLANNLVLLLFFWEGLLGIMFGMIYIGGGKAFLTAIKSFIIIGISDLTMMLGIALTAYLAHTLTISQIHLDLSFASSVAFILLMIGAIAKSGAMPFHSWIPDAAINAPLPFMAILPASIEKLLGIYFLTRICVDMFALTHTSWLSVLLMVTGSLTIIFAVMMALVQKDFKKLLSYHAISQVGYMILGIGTAVPAGIVGGLFHMLNNAIYKSCLFLTGGSVEKQTGTTNLNKLGGLALQMPVTFACFLIAALSISGVPPFNGFFSKELIYDAALERGSIYYFAAVLGSFFTAASFLKLGHAAFLGKAQIKVKESSIVMLIPMVVIALFCVIFGLNNALPINNFFEPVLGAHKAAHSFASWPSNTAIVIISLVVLFAAFIVHTFNAIRNKSGLKAADYIHHAPVLERIYDAAEKKHLDPYEIGMRFVTMLSKAIWSVDRAIDWVYGGLSAAAAFAFSLNIRRLHTGNYAVYLIWSLAASSAVIFYLIMKGH